MNRPDASIAERAQRPGGLIRLVADGLSACGYEVGLPALEYDIPALSIKGPGKRCQLCVYDCGHAELTYVPWASDEADPKQVADMATALLTGSGGHYPYIGKGYSHPGITFKGIVGLELKARGFDVELEVYEDDEYYDVLVGIVVTGPTAPDDGLVRICDDGSIVWERDYQDEAAGITGDLEYTGIIADPGKVADSVVATVASVIRLPAGAPVRGGVR